MPPDKKSDLLCYSPMLHARLYADEANYRKSAFQPTRPSPADPEKAEVYLDGNPEFDRPLTVQFCANDPDKFLEAAQQVAPYCDAVDLNLGCPQGIAKRGHYGAFLQEDQPLIYEMINTLHRELDIPVTAKMRVLETREQTLEYARMILSAGASILTVHGRERDQKGHKTGLADWEIIRYLRENLPAETVLFANGNILQHADIQRCLEATGVDGIMSAEGNLHDPSIFAEHPKEDMTAEGFWRGRDGKGGWRLDAIMRRYMDILWTHVLDQDLPERAPLFLPSGDVDQLVDEPLDAKEDSENEPPSKKRKKNQADFPKKHQSPSLSGMQAHMFNLLRPLISIHTDIRDQLARSKGGNMEAYEKVLSMVEMVTKTALIEYEREHKSLGNGHNHTDQVEDEWVLDPDSSKRAVARCKRPWWVAQAYIRPLPKEALEKGSLQLSKKERERLAKEQAANGTNGHAENQTPVEPLVEKIVDAAVAG
jgi:tRNA-dihydrouridine synthase 1